MNHNQANELLPCPFCGSAKVSPDQWSGIDGKEGPGCDDCGALAETPAAWNRRAAPTEPAASSSGDLDALVREYGNAPVTGAARTRRVVMREIYQLAGEIFGEPAVDRDAVHDARLTLIRASGDDDLIEAVKIGKVSIRAALLRVLGAAPAAPAVPQKPYLSHFATLKEYKAAYAVYEAASAPAVPAAPLVASEHDDGVEPSWRTSDISWLCAHLTENTAFSGARLQREWDAMKKIALAADAPPSPSVDQAKRLVGGEVADSDRLDWLDQVNAATNARYKTVYGWKFDLNHNRASLTDHNLPALSIRQAIDSARASTGSATSTDTKGGA